MNQEPIVMECRLNSPADKVWLALTEKDKMKQWYFDIENFKAELGFEFQFDGGSEEKKYLHLCKITELVPGEKLAYSWRYEGYPGGSLVTFDLIEEAGITRLMLTHEGLESFPANNPDFTKENFIAGWNDIIGTNLKDFVEKL